MTVRRFAFHAKESARLLARHFEHDCGLGDRVGQFELTSIDALEICMPSGPGGGAPLRRRAQGLQMHIFNPGLFERCSKRRL